MRLHSVKQRRCYTPIRSIQRVEASKHRESSSQFSHPIIVTNIISRTRYYIHVLDDAQTARDFLTIHKIPFNDARFLVDTFVSFPKGIVDPDIRIFSCICRTKDSRMANPSLWSRCNVIFELQYSKWSLVPRSIIILLLLLLCCHLIYLINR